MTVAILYTKRNGLQFDVGEFHRSIVQNALPDAEVILADSTEELEAKGIDPEILICWATGHGMFIAEDYCMKCKNLKWIHGLSAGVEGITYSPVADIPGLRLTNSKGIHSIPIPETIMGYMLNNARGLLKVYDNDKVRGWNRFVPDELYEKNLVILGMGAIATGVAKRAKGFDMHITGVKRTVCEVPYVDEVLPEDQMDEAIAKADYLVDLLPDTPATHNTMDARRFALMKDGAFFINAGRGVTVDTDALVAALQSGKLSGCALDALNPEPLPADHPLWSCENTFISPHMSAESPRYMERAFGVFVQNLPYYLKGEKMPTEIDLARKY